MIVAKVTPPAQRVSPAWLKRLRGLLAVPVAVALLVGAPGLAYAAFTAQTTAALSVGTYKVPAPASINGTLVCTNNGGNKGAEITFTGFSGVDRATSYTARLTHTSGGSTVTHIAGNTGPSIYMSLGAGRGIYTFQLEARVGSWTGLPLPRTVSC